MMFIFGVPVPHKLLSAGGWGKDPIHSSSVQHTVMHLLPCLCLTLAFLRMMFEVTACTGP